MKSKIQKNHNKKKLEKSFKLVQLTSLLQIGKIS